MLSISGDVVVFGGPDSHRASPLHASSEDPRQFSDDYRSLQNDRFISFYSQSGGVGAVRHIFLFGGPDSQTASQPEILRLKLRGRPRTVGKACRMSPTLHPTLQVLLLVLVVILFVSRAKFWTPALLQTLRLKLPGISRVTGRALTTSMTLYSTLELVQLDLVDTEAA